MYSLSASVVYLAAYPILNAMFGTSLLTLGIYLPLLVVEPLLTYRFGRVQETLHKAVSKGLRITVGYALLLMLLGCVREWLALGTVFGTPVGHRAVLPMAGMPAGGFIVLGVLCAVWRALAARAQGLSGTGSAQPCGCACTEGGGRRAMRDVVNAWVVFFGYAVLAVFAQNAIFTAHWAFRVWCSWWAMTAPAAGCSACSCASRRCWWPR